LMRIGRSSSKVVSPFDAYEKLLRSAKVENLYSIVTAFLRRLITWLRSLLLRPGMDHIDTVQDQDPYVVSLLRTLKH